jgi:hypothetical protein
MLQITTLFDVSHNFYSLGPVIPFADSPAQMGMLDWLYYHKDSGACVDYKAIDNEGKLGDVYFELAMTRDLHEGFCRKASWCLTICQTSLVTGDFSCTLSPRQYTIYTS